MAPVHDDLECLVPNPRSLVGRLLVKIKGGKRVAQPQLEPTPTTPSPAELKIAEGRERMLQTLTKVSELIDALPELARPNLLHVLNQLQGTLHGMDDLPDVPAKSHRLMQAGEVLSKLREAVAKAKRSVPSVPVPEQPSSDSGSGESDTPELTPEPEPPKPDPVALKALADALDNLRRAQTTAGLLRSQVTVDLGALPTVLADRLDELERSLALDQETDPLLINQAAEASTNALVEIEKSAKKLVAQKQSCELSIGLIQGRIQVLESHAKATTDHVRDKIDAIKVTLGEIKVLAGKHDYTQADTQLLTLAETCLGVEAVADQHSAYSLMLADRQERVDALLDSTAVPAQTLVTAVRGKLATAKNEAAAKKFAEAVVLLNQIPKDCIDAAWLTAKAGEYDAALDNADKSLQKAKTWKDKVPGKEAELLACETALTAAKFEQTSDYVKSVSLLGRVSGKINGLFEALVLVAAFEKAYKAADLAVTGLKTHQGASGITAALDVIKADLLYAQAKGNAKEYPTGTGMCANILTQVAAAKLVADQCKTYLDKLKLVSDKKTKLEESDVVATGEDLIDQADVLIRDAADKALTPDFAAATRDLEAAGNRLTQAEQILQHAETLQKWMKQVAPSLENVANDFEPAYQQFAVIRLHVLTIDKGNDFADLLQQAQDAADEARRVGTGPGADPDAAAELLLQAILLGARVTMLVDQKKSFDAQHKDIDTRVKALRSKPALAVMEEQLDKADEKLVEAQNQANQREYPLGQPLLTQADQFALEAERRTKVYDTYQLLRKGDVQASLTTLDTVKGKEAMDTEVTKLKADVAKADELLTTDKKVDEAYKALLEVQPFGKSLEVKLDDYKKARAAEKKKITDVIGVIKDQAAVASHYEAIKAQLLQLKAMFEQGQFKQAANMARTIASAIKYATNIVKRQSAHDIELAKAQKAISDLKLVACDAVKDDIKTVENFLSKAQALALDGNYEGAAPHLVTVLQRCVPATAMGKAQAAYALALKAAQDAVAALRKDFPQLDAVSLQADALSAKLATAEQLASKKSFDAAKVLATEVASAVSGVRATGTAHAEFGDAAERVAQLPKDTTDGLEAEIAAVQLLATKLGGRKLDEVLGPQLLRIDRLLKQAESERVANQATHALAALGQAAEACAQANALADQFEAVNQGIKAAEKESEAIRLRHAKPAYVGATLDYVGKLLGLAQLDAQQGLFSSAQNQLNGILTQLREVNEVGEKYALYQARRLQVDGRATELAKQKARYAVAGELGEARAYIVEGDAHADQRNFVEAQKMLAAADELLDGASLRADMLDDKEPTKEALMAILSKPGGDKKLDDIIASLDQRARRRACQAAIELRFNIKLSLYIDTDGTLLDTNKAKKAPDILRLYDVMKAVPKEHTKDNPCMDKVMRIGDEAGTSSYNKQTRQLKLRVGRANDKTERMIGQEWQMGEVDADAKPTDNEPPTKFSWTTLHEIGHALDDKKGFMSANGSKEAYGGWKEYGANVGEIAQAAADHFTYDKAYIAAYLSGEKPLAPKSRGGVSAQEWNQRRIQAEVWCDSIRSAKSIYYDAAACDRLQIGGRVYQEAYANRWVSYSHAARKKGVAGYQFRAPGEWFAELYASFHTGKMNEKHPARAWLSKL
jgi:hypothetical protein